MMNQASSAFSSTGACVVRNLCESGVVYTQSVHSCSQPTPSRATAPMNQTKRVGKALLALLLLTSCSSLPLVKVPSENQNSRVNHLVIHFTSEAFGPSLKALTQTSDRPVSAHYLIPRLGDATYPYAKLKILLFILGVFTIIISELSVKLASINQLAFIVFLFIPILIFFLTFRLYWSKQFVNFSEM